jgi:hypothetical protein
MPEAFRSDRQKRLFDAVLNGVEQLGYRGVLTQRNYEFTDWFEAPAPTCRIPAAAFGRTPTDYDSACLAVFLQNGGSAPLRYRALGAPFGIEVQEDAIIPWSIGHDAFTTRHAANRIPADALGRFFQSVASKWGPAETMRAKNIGTSSGPAEVDWIDLGLIPALEAEISGKLDILLRSALSAGQKTYRRSTGNKPDAEELYRLVFRLIAGKVFHDRKVGEFRHLDATEDARAVLRAVCAYYDEPNNYLADRETQQAMADALWTKLSFQNLSVDALALISEDTLVDDSLRKEYGIHGTPHRIARYIVERLPFERIPQDERIVVEPCSGHAVFLVAALKRLRDLLGPGWNERKRHRYFADRLLGFELDSFAREVSKLCLTLADFPNPNGWNLEKADVFTSRKFTDALAHARIVLCNPPFEEFKRHERERYKSAVGALKPLEVLRRVLRHSHREACLGFVLPRPFVDGASFRETRRDLAKRFAHLELVALPDKVFRHAEVESVLLLAHTPELRERTQVHFREVLKPQLVAFYDSGAVSREDIGSFTAEEAGASGFHVPVLQEIWEHLADLPKLKSVATIHRGVEWKAPFDEKAYCSKKPRSGFVRGLFNVEEGFQSFSFPPPTFLNADRQFRRGNAWDLRWDLPKVVTNAVRKARGAWRLAAAFDVSGLTCTQSYQCLWPTGQWSTRALSALMNSPVASAFMATHERNLHNRKITLERLPIPRFTPADMVMLEGLVDAYMATMNEQPESRLELWGGGSWQQRAKNILLEMDALILRAYRLPPWLERKLLDFFRGERRPVPFDFGDYFPRDFTPNIPLTRFISQRFRSSRAEIITPHLPELRDAALTDALAEIA